MCSAKAPAGLGIKSAIYQKEPASNDYYQPATNVYQGAPIETEEMSSHKDPFFNLFALQFVHVYHFIEQCMYSVHCVCLFMVRTSSFHQICLFLISMKQNQYLDPDSGKYR